MEFAKNELVKHYNFSIDYVNKIAYEYEKFMEIKNLDNDCSPSDDIDLLWHQIILDTEFYYNYCINRFNKIIHHKPQNAIDQKERKIRLKKTIELYKNTFSEQPDEQVWNVNNNIDINTNTNTNTETNNELININVIKIPSYKMNFNVNKLDTIYSIKQKIKTNLGICEETQKIVYNQNVLDNSLTVDDYNIKNNDTIYLILSMSGC